MKRSTKVVIAWVVVVVIYVMGIIAIGQFLALLIDRTADVVLSAEIEEVEIPGYDEVVKLYNQAESPDSVQGKEWTEAHAIAEEALWLYLGDAGDGAEPMAYLLMGELQRRQNRHCRSIDFYAKALKKSRKKSGERKWPTRYVLHHAGVNMAYACLQCGEVDLAEATVKLMRVDAQLTFNDDVLACAAVVYRRRGHDEFNASDFTAAIDWYAKASQMRPGWPGIACDLARTHLRLCEMFEEEGDGKRAKDHAVRGLQVVEAERFEKFKKGQIQDLRERLRKAVART